MPTPFPLEDRFGTNFVDEINRNIDQEGNVYYELKGRNRFDEPRILHIYVNNRVKAFIIKDSKLTEANEHGHVHEKMQEKLPEIVSYFELPATLDFTPPFVIHDKEGNNYVDFVTRKIDENGLIYYELKGRNKNNEARIIHLYDNNLVKPYVVIENRKTESPENGRVHLQMHAKLSKILKHFSIKTPLDFKHSTLPPEKIIPNKPPAIIPFVEEATLPSREFFIAAAHRAIELGDNVSTQQKGVHPTRGLMIGSGSTFYDEGNSTRLNLFNELVDGSKEGYYPFAATTAYGLSLLTFIACNYDSLSQTELHQLYIAYRAVAGDIPALDLNTSSSEYRKALAKGLKAEVNEVTALRERLAYGHSIDESLTKYDQDIIVGNPKGRPIVDKQTSFMGSSSGDTLTRDIPAFFPIPPSAGTSDQIVLQAGGCRTHSAIVCIWKQGVDIDGNPVLPGDGKTIERYRVYRTVCNAGFGTTFDVRTTPPALYHEISTSTPEGQTYSVCTQEILLPLGQPYNDEVMQKQIANLIHAERSMLIFHDLPGNKGPNNEVGTSNQTEQSQWRKLNQSVRLGPVEKTHSVLSKPQTTGNCTVRSIEEYLRWELIRNGVSHQDTARILDKHWDFATHNNSSTINYQLNKLLAKVEIFLKSKEMSSAQMNTVQAIDFFKNPIIPNFPQYRPDTATPEETTKLVQSIRHGEISCPKPTMIILGDLLDQIAVKPSIKVNNNIGHHLLYGCDSRVAPQFSCMQGSVRQVASQFNYGESKGRYLTSPNYFKKDPTQGPSEQRTSGGAAIARFAHSASCDAFAVILSNPELYEEFHNLFDYKYGYLTPKQGQEKQGFEFLKKHIDQLVLNVERVSIDDVPGQTAIQVLNAGLALGAYDIYTRTPEATEHLKAMTEFLHTAQYKSVSAVSLLEAQHNPKKRIPVSFTLVGGGAFGNEPIAIAKSLSQAIKLIHESGLNNIDICLSIYSSEELSQYKKIAATGEEFADLREILNQKPINQTMLKNLTSFRINPTDKALHIDIKKKEASPNEEKTVEVKKIFRNEGIIKAMEAAITSLSKKSHLSAEGHRQKKQNLERLLTSYQTSDSLESANEALLKFLLVASKQRESNWSSLFTSKFGETASANAFFEKIRSEGVSSVVLNAAKITLKGKQFEFKEFAEKIRDTYEQATVLVQQSNKRI